MDNQDHALTTLNITDFESQGHFLGQLKQFLRTQMQDGIDFGTIPMGGGHESKPCLFKPGAEKLLNFFGYTAQFLVANKVEDHEKGYFFYKYQCTIHNKAGLTVADGFGSANTRERKWERQPPWDVVNTVDKMAQKRALLQATLLATRASEFYTQDIEDMPIETVAPRPKRIVKANAAAAEDTQEYVCSQCNVKIPKVVNLFSMKRYGKSLCRNCQIQAAPTPYTQTKTTIHDNEPTFDEPPF